MGIYNPKLHLTQEYDKGSPPSVGKGPKGKGKGAPQSAPQGNPLAQAIEGTPEEDPASAGAGLAVASRHDDSDIVRQFQASGGGALNAPSGGGGAYSDDAIASAAQGFLRTAGRVYSLAEQRELEDEFHPKGARNLNGLDLEGTHYL